MKAARCCGVLIQETVLVQLSSSHIIGSKWWECDTPWYELNAKRGSKFPSM